MFTNKVAFTPSTQCKNSKNKNPINIFFCYQYYNYYYYYYYYYYNNNDYYYYYYYQYYY